MTETALTRTREPFNPNDEQRDALRHDRNLCLCAGAGSGKTATLVAKYVELLERGIDPGKILAFTFTEKAAAEMQIRAREELALRLDAETDLEKAVRLDACRQRLAGGWISTIHAFGARILREHAAESGVDPSFRLLADEEAESLRESAAARAVIDAASSQDLRAAEMSARFLLYGAGPNGQSLVDCISNLHEKMRAYAVSPEQLEVPADPPEPDLTAAAGALKRLAELPTENTRLKTRVDAIRAALEAVLAEKFRPETFFGALTAGGWNFRDRRIASVQGKKPKPFDEAFEALSAELADAGDRAAARVETQSIETLRRLLVRTDELYTAEKRRRSSLDFSDLEQLAFRLLLERPDVRRHYRERFEAVLVDEFQDVNPIQVRIIELLVDGRTSALFAVGDWEQSIYRFRGADVNEFTRLWMKLAADGCAMALRRNHRSRRSLVEVINRIYAQNIWSTECVQGRSQPPFEPMEVPEEVEQKRAPSKTSPILWMALPEHQHASARRETEAAAIAEEIRSGGRPWGDYALLFRKTSSMAPFEESFRQTGIPYEIVKGGRAFESQEVFDLLNVLTSAFDPSDRMAFLGALRSPLAQLSDRALLLLSENGGDLRDPFLSGDGWPQGFSEEDRTAAESFRNLRTALIGRANLSPAALLSWLVSESGLRSILSALGETRARLKNIDALLRLAGRFAEHRPDPHRAFLETAWRLVRQGERQSSSADDPESDSVKLMTTHQAKGLQFPVVVLPDLYGQASSASPIVHFLAEPAAPGATSESPRQGRLAFRVDVPGSGDTWKTPRYLELADREDASENEERERLLYVALTRAEDRVILLGPAGPGSRSDGSARSWKKGTLWTYVYPFLQKAHAAREAWLDVRRIPPIQQPDPPMPAGPDRALVERSAGKVWRGFSTPPARRMYSARDFLSERDPSVRSIGTFRFAVALGTAAHDLLARLPLKKEFADQKKWLGARLRKLRLGKDIPPEKIAELSDRLTQFLQGPLAETLRRLSPARVFREHPFLLRRENAEITGKIDLLVVDEDAVRIIDYKYESPKETFGVYRGQLMAYALAVMTALDLKEVTVGLQYLIGAQALREERISRAGAEAEVDSSRTMATSSI